MKKITPKLQTVGDNNSEDGNGIDGPGSDFEVKRKWNGNGHENRCDGEEYAKILELLGFHQELGLYELANKEASKGE